MSSHLTEDQIQTYLDNKDRSDRSSIEEHLAICPSCMGVLNEYKQLYGLLETDPFPELSKDFNLRWVLGERVRLESDDFKKDQYGRLLAYAFLDGDEMINAILIRHGLAHVFVKSPNGKYFDLMLEFQRQAMNEKLGIWKNIRKSPEKQYLGNNKSFRFHRTSCPFAKKIATRNLIKFENRYISFWAGFSPCEKCLP